MKVLVVDDHTMMRQGLRAILEQAGNKYVSEASSGRDAIALAKRLRPDAVIMDVSMPGLNGIDATRCLTAELPKIRVVALSMHADRRYVLAMFEAGAAGYLLKNAAAQELLTALQVVARGLRYVSPTVAGVVLDELTNIQRSAAASASAVKPLSIREREVLQLIAEGHSSKEIAGNLGIALATVETHRRQIMDKLDLRTIAELTKYAVREGLTTLEF